MQNPRGACDPARPAATRGWTYSFLRADFLFSSLSSWAASLSLTSDPGALAGIMSSCSSLLCGGHSGFYVANTGARPPCTPVNRCDFLKISKFRNERHGAKCRNVVCHFCFTAALSTARQNALLFCLTRSETKKAKSPQSLSARSTHGFVGVGGDAKRRL